jgi:hypothetical protein
MISVIRIVFDAPEKPVEPASLLSSGQLSFFDSLFFFR